ncbi:MAG: transposase [Deltaproteobacteria bacterium]|nr:transposase [Deltaproteobacteria bacterium]
MLFVTTCTRDRRPILANEPAHGLLREGWSLARTWRVGRYVIMPDHIHLFCAPADPNVSLSHWVRFWKSHVSRRWPDPSEQPIWQPSCWDTQLRRRESYDAKWEYARMNPVRRGLVADPERWPYAGAIDVLAW